MTRFTWKKAALGSASGALLALAMPGFGFGPLVVGALIPLFFALDEERGFWPGWFFGAVFFGIDLRWIVTLARFHPIVIAGYLALIVIFGIGGGLLGTILAWKKRSSILTWLLLAPAAFALAEFIRTLGPLSLGFSTLYSTLYRAPWAIQAAAFLGPWFLSFTLTGINGALYLALRKRRLAYLGISVGLAALLIGFQWMPSRSESLSPLDVAVVSSKVDQKVKLDGRNLDALTERYLALGTKALESQPDLVVFPESILPSYILQNEPLKDAFAHLARDGGMRVLLGTGEYRDRSIFNAVALFSEAGALVGTYHMVWPVPFGEYIPGRRVLEWIGLGGWARSFLPLDLSRGDGFDPLEDLGTPICFESTFPAPSRQFTQNGAHLLITVTNDAWFNESSALPAHFASGVFRAVENRRWFIQSANGGISGVISPRGEIVASLNAEGVLIERVHAQAGRSVYTRWGDLPLLLGSLTIALGVYAHRLWPLKQKRGERMPPAPSIY